MEMILSPSILAADFGILGEQIRRCESAGAKYLHIDVMDGIFVPNISFGLPVIESIRPYVNTFFDVHLMIENPERYIDRFIDAGADGITFHAEAARDIEHCLAMIRSRGRKAGIAVSPSTPVDVVLPYLTETDMVLCMTVEPGYGGQKYMPHVNEKLRRLRHTAGDSLNIQVDGGITPENIRIPLKAGANVIVAGSAVFHGDVEENIRRLQSKMSGLL